MRLLKIAIVILSVVSFSDCMSEKAACESNISRGDAAIFCGMAVGLVEGLKQAENKGDQAEIAEWKGAFVMSVITCLERY